MGVFGRYKRYTILMMNAYINLRFVASVICFFESYAINKVKLDSNMVLTYYCNILYNTNKNFTVQHFRPSKFNNNNDKTTINIDITKRKEKKTTSKQKQ